MDGYRYDHYNLQYDGSGDYNDDINTEVESVLIIILIAIGCSSSLYEIGRYMIKSCQATRRMGRLVIRRLTSVDDNLLNECSICLDKYVINDKLIELSCTHNFHESCILPWIKDHNTCPHCRRNII